MKNEGRDSWASSTSWLRAFAIRCDSIMSNLSAEHGDSSGTFDTGIERDSQAPQYV